MPAGKRGADLARALMREKQVDDRVGDDAESKSAQ